MFCLFGIVFFTQGNNVHMFSHVFEWIVSKNKWLPFSLSVSIQNIHFLKKNETLLMFLCNHKCNLWLNQTVLRIDIYLFDEAWSYISDYKLFTNELDDSYDW